MANIYKTDVYPFDPNISAQDYLIGTDSDNLRKTRNFKVGLITATIIEQIGAANGNKIMQGTLTHLGGLFYQTSTISYIIGEQYFEVAPVIIEFNPPTGGKRVDVIYVDNEGELGVIEGETNSIPASPPVNGTARLVFTQVFIEYGTSQSNKILEGGFISWNTGFSHYVSKFAYILQNESYTSEGGDVVFENSHETLNRIDAIAVDVAGDLLIIKGEPSAIPAEPRVDQLLYTLVSYVDIPAGSTTIPGVSELIVYAENAGVPTEFNGATADTDIILDDPNFPHDGSTVSVLSRFVPVTEGFQPGKTVSFTDDETHLTSSYTAIEFWIRLDAPIEGRNPGFLNIGIHDTNNYNDNRQAIPSSTSTNSSIGYGYNEDVIEIYQRVIFPLDKFDFLPETFDTILFYFDGEVQASCWIDDVRLIGGGTTVVNAGSFLDLTDVVDSSYISRAGYELVVNDAETGIVLRKKYWIRIDNDDIGADLHKADGNLDMSSIENGDIVRSALFKATNTIVPYGTYDSSGGPNTDIDNYSMPLFFN